MKLAWDRLNDLRLLAEMRNTAQEGERMQQLFWQINFLLLSGATSPNLMYNEAATLAQQLDPKWNYNSRELITLYMRAKQHEEGKKVSWLGKEYSPLYTPKNDFLIDLFSITATEETKLTTIISGVEKTRRNSVSKTEKRRKEGVVEREIYLRQKDVRKQKALSLRETGLSYGKIAEFKTIKGRIDAFIETDSHIYNFEFKTTQTEEVALDQIKDREYYKRFMDSKKQIVLIGSRFVVEDKKIVNRYISG